MNMKHKRIVIHIGAHKTGTTSVQQFFARHRAALILRGAHYPESCRHHFAQHRLAFALKGRRVPGSADVPDFATEIESLRAEIGRAGDATVFVSSEELFSLPREKVELLGAALQGLQVQILAVLRRLTNCSRRSTTRKSGHAQSLALRHVGFLSDPSKLSPDLRFDFALDCWAAVFGREAMVVRCLEQYPNVLELVAAALGIDLAGLDRNLPRVNRSVSVRTAELIRLGKKAGLPIEQLRRLGELGEELFGEAGRSESLLSPQERMQVLGNADQMTEQVFRSYVGTENIYASSRFNAEGFPARTALDSGDLMRVIVELLALAPER
ncbi:MAG: hypothetical protein IPG91_05560 [Ideonella sp.]|nr:hypothetical protein [Ideonella sp.]